VTGDGRRGGFDNGLIGPRTIRWVSLGRDLRSYRDGLAEALRDEGRVMLHPERGGDGRGA